MSSFCMATVKGHIKDIEGPYYLVVTDLMADVELRIPHHAVKYPHSLRCNDEVHLRYSVSSTGQLIVENNSIKVLELLPVTINAFGLVTGGCRESVTLDNIYTLPRDCIEGSRFVQLDWIMEFEAVKCTNGRAPYRCLWGRVLDATTRDDPFDMHRQNELVLTSACSRQCAVKIPQREIIFPIPCNGQLPGDPRVETLTISNISRRIPLEIIRLSLPQNSVAQRPYFRIRSPIIAEGKPLTLPGNGVIKVEIEATPGPEHVIFQQGLVIHFSNFTLLRCLHLIHGQPDYIKDYTEKYKTTDETRHGPQLLESFSASHNIKQLKRGDRPKGYANTPFVSQNWQMPNEMTRLLLIEFWQSPLERSYPVIFEPLSPKNYTNKLHKCLFLEELALFREFQKRSLSNYQLKPTGEGAHHHNRFLIDTPLLEETRPSLLKNDTVVCKIVGTEDQKMVKQVYQRHTNGKKRKRQDDNCYTGYIVGLRPDHVVVQMESKFERHLLYDVSFCFTRKRYLDAHRAIESIQQSPRRACLFPTAALLKSQPSMDALLDVEICPLGQLTIRYGGDQEAQPLSLHRPDLDAGQRRVVRNVLRGQLRVLPYLIRGPPGTGKTTTLVEIMLQLMEHDMDAKLLVCTASNSAANLILKSLVVSQKLRKDELVRLVSNRAYDHKLVPEDLLPYCAAFFGAPEEEEDENGGAAVPVLESASPSIRTDLKVADLKAVRIIVLTVGLVPRLVEAGMESTELTHLFIDEAAQCLETEILPVLNLIEGKRSQIILAGDDRQLGPCITCLELAETEFVESLFERLMKRPLYDNQSVECNAELSNQLNYNYRSIPSILGLFNDLFYNSQLKPMVVEGQKFELLRRLQTALPVNGERRDTHGIVFYDVLGTCQRSQTSPSYLNPMEALVVTHLVQEIRKLDVPEEDIGIITPYRGQVRFLREQLTAAGVIKAKVGSVEEFQGQERPVIILSAVRSSEEAFDFSEQLNLGFLKNSKRLNVAISRAQSLLIIVGNAIVMTTDPNWKKAIEYCERRAAFVATEVELLQLLGFPTAGREMRVKLHKSKRKSKSKSKSKSRNERRDVH